MYRIGLTGGVGSGKSTVSSYMKEFGIPVIDVVISGKRSPLMVAVGQTTASLYKCFSGELRKIAYPDFP